MLSSKTKPAKLDALTGMRFFAAYAVLLHHLEPFLDLSQIGFPAGGLMGRLFGQFDLSQIQLAPQAVSFFFVLSGFVLTYNYAERLTPEGKRRFWFQRFARIYPLHWVNLLAVLFLLSGYSDFANYNSQQWLTLGLNSALLQSWVPLESYAFSFNNVAWSLSVEFFFYLMFPWLLASGKKLVWSCLALIGMVLLSLGLLDWYLQQNPEIPKLPFRSLGHTFPPARLAEFAIGMLAGRYYLAHQSVLTRSLSWATAGELSLLAILAMNHMLLTQVIRFLYSHFEDNGTLAIYLIFSGELGVFALATILLAHGRGLFARLLSSRLMVYLGEISFSLYLCHQVAFRLMYQAELFQSQLGLWGDLVVLHVVVLATSVLLYELVEMPCKAWLTGLYDRRERSCRGWLLNWSGPLRSARVWLSFALLVLVIPLALTIKGTPRFPKLRVTSPSLAQITRAAPAHLREVVFAGTARFLGSRARATNQLLCVDMVFRPLKGQSGELNWLLEAVDDRGHPLASFELQQVVTAGEPPAVRYLHSYVLQLPENVQRFHVAVSLQKPDNRDTGDRGVVSIVNGPPGLGGERLILGSFERGAVPYLDPGQIYPENGEPLLLPFPPPGN